MLDTNALAWMVIIYAVIIFLIGCGVAIGLEHLVPYVWHHIHWVA